MGCVAKPKTMNSQPQAYWRFEVELGAHTGTIVDGGNPGPPQVPRISGTTIKIYCPRWCKSILGKHIGISLGFRV